VLFERVISVEAKVGRYFVVSGLLTIGPVFTEKALLLTSEGTALQAVQTIQDKNEHSINS